MVTKAPFSKVRAADEGGLCLGADRYEDILANG